MNSNLILRASVRKTQSGWEGVIRKGNQVVWGCGHNHQNRDETTMSNVAAADCSHNLFDALTDPESVTARIKAWHEYHSTACFQYESQARHSWKALKRLESALAIASTLRSSLMSNREAA